MLGMRRRKHGREKAEAKMWQENYEQQAFHAEQNGRCAFAAIYRGHGIQTRVRLASRCFDILSETRAEKSPAQQLLFSDRSIRSAASGISSPSSLTLW
jgi:hypothetical protein